MKNIDGRTKLLAIFGHPVGHSKSPCMHNALFDKLGINAAYVPLSPEPSELGLAISGFRALGFWGANVTIPFKEKVGEFLDGLSDISRFTGSVNTLYWENGIVGGKLLGTTTDPYGALSDLAEHGVSVKGSHVAVLGNGGAARSIAFALMKEGASVTVVSRNEEKGKALASALAEAFPDKEMPRHILFVDFANIAGDVDLVLNATSVGMSPNVDESPLPKDVLNPRFVVCDIVYNPLETKLLREAKNAGCKVIGGSAMLVFQGAKSFEFWFPGERADVQVMKSAIGLAEGV
ncbi:MAG: shikimate dehydrogenase [Fibrobacteraceae bacterium]|nr:shikimate dehydrogenase [Fibrobacteraceae bacterium]